MTAKTVFRRDRLKDFMILMMLLACILDNALGTIYLIKLSHFVNPDIAEFIVSNMHFLATALVLGFMFYLFANVLFFQDVYHFAKKNYKTLMT